MNEIQVKDSTQIVLSAETMDSMKRFAETMAEAKDVSIPKHLQGKPADCLAIIMKASQWGMNPYDVASKTHVVSGSMGYEAQLVNAVITSSTAIDGRFHYKYSGEWKSSEDPEAWIMVGAILKGEGEIQWGEKLYPCTVKVKNSPLWKTNPKQQAAYLGLKYWARLYAPHVIMGVYTSDELEPMAEKDITPAKSALAGIINKEPEIIEQAEEETPPALTLAENRAIDLQTALDAINQAYDVESLTAAYDVATDHLTEWPKDKEFIAPAYAIQLEKYQQQ